MYIIQKSHLAYQYNWYTQKNTGFMMWGHDISKHEFKLNQCLTSLN